MPMENATINGPKARRVLHAAVALLMALGPAWSCRAQPPAERTIVFFGDSLTAGYGLSDPGADSYPARIQARIDAERLHWRVVNAGLSGETSAGGLRRIDWVLNQKVDAFVLELGANDGLRGTATEVTQANLQGIIDRVRLKDPQARIVLVGMRMPPNMGQDYAGAFQALFPALAKKNGTALVPFLLEGVAERPDLNQGDGIHPNPSGAALVADNVWKVIFPILTAGK
jgi:acyl-CoA thioesterase-1